MAVTQHVAQVRLRQLKLVGQPFVLGMRGIQVSEKYRGIKSDGIIYRGLVKYHGIPSSGTGFQ